ncbi:hypothetical protein D3C76_1201990 [compost metagenome]
MSVTRADIEMYLMNYVVLERNPRGVQWGIDNAGAAGDFQYGDVEELEGDDGLPHLRGRTFPTQHEALQAGLGYIWACRPDLIAIARNDAASAKEYQTESGEEP